MMPANMEDSEDSACIKDEEMPHLEDKIHLNCYDKQIKFKEPKMIFDRGSNLFDDKEEERMAAIREKASVLKLQIIQNKGMADGAKEYAEREMKKIKIKWPALFGEIPDKIYVHIDLDSFYASVETISHPEYKDIPLGIGTNLMLAACNYKAREYGVRSGMPGYKAKDICPMIVIAKPNFKRINHYSERVMEILSSYDPEIEIYGIDEACLIFDEEKLKKGYGYFNSNRTNGRSAQDGDLGSKLKYGGFSFQGVDALVSKMRLVVQRNTGLTVSAGISVCRGLAKLSSKMNKPNGQHILSSDFESFIANMEVDEINGIGKCTKELLYRLLDVKYVKDLRERIHLCSLVFRPRSFCNILRLSLGLSFFDHKTMENEKSCKIKSFGAEISFAPVAEYSEILFYLWNISEQVKSRMGKKNQAGDVVTIRIKYLDFRSITKRRKCLELVKDHTRIFDISVELLNQTLRKVSDYNGYEIDNPIRMIGISISGCIDLAETMLIDKFYKSKAIYKNRTCIICNETFINEPDNFFIAHVNNCIDDSENRLKKTKNSLLKYFRPKK